MCYVQLSKDQQKLLEEWRYFNCFLEEIVGDFYSGRLRNQRGVLDRELINEKLNSMFNNCKSLFNAKNEKNEEKYGFSLCLFDYFRCMIPELIDILLNNSNFKPLYEARSVQKNEVS